MILADQYPAINSTEVKQYLKNKGILLILTTVNHAESNGLNEGVNQTLVNRIRCKINSGDKRAWSRIAAECVEEYDRTNHNLTKFAPDYLMYGKTSEIVPKLLIEHRDLQKDRCAALLNSINDFKRNKQRIDRLRKEETFKLDDYVFVENGKRLNKSKLKEVRSRPYKVLRRLSKRRLRPLVLS